MPQVRWLKYLGDGWNGSTQATCLKSWSDSQMGTLILLCLVSPWLACIVWELQEEALQRRQAPHRQALIKPRLVMLAKISSAKASHILKPRLKWKGTQRIWISALSFLTLTSDLISLSLSFLLCKVKMLPSLHNLGD